MNREVRHPRRARIGARVLGASRRVRPTLGGAPWTVALLLLVACGPSPADMPDAALADASVDATSDAGTDDAAVSADPAAPEPPRWTCPAGWTTARVAGVDACDLPPAERCAAGHAHFLGADGCAPVGAACAGEFAAELPASGVLFVRPGAGGDGTRGSPLGTLSAAAAIAHEGDVIALSVGAHEGGVSLPSGVTVRGACAAETLIVAPEALDGPVVVVAAGARAALEDLRVVPGEAIGVGVAGRATLRGVVVDTPHGAGVLVSASGELTVDALVVRGARPLGGGGGTALLVDGTVTGRRVILEDAFGAALFVRDGAVELEDLRAWSIPAGPLSRGAGVVVTAGSVTLRRVDLRGATNRAIEVTGGALRLEDVLVEDLTVVDPPGAYALYVRDGGELAIERATVRSAGWLVHAERASLTVRDAALEGMGEGRLYAEEVGVAIVDAPFELERVSIAHVSSGLLALGPFDFTIPLDPDDPPPDPEPPEPIDMAIADLRLADIGGEARFGYGISLDVPFRGAIARVLGERIRGLALDLSGALTLSDVEAREPLTARDHLGQPSFARGLAARETAVVTLTRARFEDTLDVAVEVLGSALTLRDVTIVRAHERACAREACSAAPGGVGLGAYFGAVVEAEALHIDGADLCGVQLARDANVDLRGGSIRGATVGVCVQVDGYDVRRLTNGVTYADNGTNVESTSHAIPAAPPPPSL